MAAGMAWAALAAPCGSALADGFGPVGNPLPIPPLPAMLSDGRRVDRRRWLPGKVSAMQFMLTTCSTTCPLLGAIFASTQQELAALRRKDVQLLSVSVDVLGDSPERLREWLKRFGAGPDWHAALPDARSSAALDALRSLGAGTPEGDQHAAGILVIDRQGRLAYRLDEMADPRVLTRTLLEVAAR